MSPLDFRLQRKPAGLATKGRKYSIFEGVFNGINFSWWISWSR